MSLSSLIRYFVQITDYRYIPTLRPGSRQTIKQPSAEPIEASQAEQADRLMRGREREREKISSPTPPIPVRYEIFTIKREKNSAHLGRQIVSLTKKKI